MRRLAAIAAFALFLAVPLWAQHGGGHGGGGGGHSFGGGGHSGSFGGHAGGGGVSHGSSFSGGSHSFSHAPAISHNFSHGPYLHDGFRGRFHTYGFRNNCYGYACRGYGYPGGWGYYDPWLWGWWNNDDAEYDNSYDQNVAEAAEMNRENLEQQRMFRQEQADGDQDAYASQYQGPRREFNSAQDEKAGAPIFSSTVLVFRDKHQQEVENYAIVGQTLWSFAPQHTQKISIAELDLPATAKANQDRGITFRVPDSNEMQ